MTRTVDTQKAPTPQELYDGVNDYIRDLEDDVYGLEPLFLLLGQIKAFLENNHEVS